MCVLNREFEQRAQPDIAERLPRSVRRRRPLAEANSGLPRIRAGERSHRALGEQRAQSERPAVRAVAHAQGRHRAKGVHATLHATRLGAAREHEGYHVARWRSHCRLQQRLLFSRRLRFIAHRYFCFEFQQ